jgi:hypothetical protein
MAITVRRICDLDSARLDDKEVQLRLAGAEHLLPILECAAGRQRRKSLKLPIIKPRKGDRIGVCICVAHPRTIVGRAIQHFTSGCPIDGRAAYRKNRNEAGQTLSTGAWAR